jgi:hypothetical protein
MRKEILPLVQTPYDLLREGEGESG